LDDGLALVAAEEEAAKPLDLSIGPDDARLVAVRDLLDEYGGVIFVGPPGTSKTWYAAQVAAALVDRDPERVRFVQFHPSYQYEDFVEGFAPTVGGGFLPTRKHLLELCELAEADREQVVVLVIDELSRGDAARIFGEALTYIEKSKRDLSFSLASGRQASIPPNLVVIATMNPLDRGVDDVDAAFERRFGRIAFDPDPGLLTTVLNSNGVSEDLQNRVLKFFRGVQQGAKNNPYAQIGHTYFFGIKSEADLRRLWDHQLRFVFAKAYRLDPPGLKEIREAWEKVTMPNVAPAADQEGEADG
jgi:5-methylcytosine-specific restriction protein B